MRLLGAFLSLRLKYLSPEPTTMRLYGHSSVERAAKGQANQEHAEKGAG